MDSFQAPSVFGLRHRQSNYACTRICRSRSYRWNSEYRSLARENNAFVIPSDWLEAWGSNSDCSMTKESCHTSRRERTCQLSQCPQGSINEWACFSRSLEVDRLVLTCAVSSADTSDIDSFAVRGTSNGNTIDTLKTCTARATIDQRTAARLTLTNTGGF